MLNSERKKILLYLGGFLILSVALIYLAQGYYLSDSVSAGYLSEEEAEESSEAFLLKKRKATILENSYYTSLTLGDEYIKKNEHAVAANKYFDAKSIYPSAIEPRMSLSRILHGWALDNSAYCWKAQKEVLFALKYVRLSQYPNEFRELQLMKAELESRCGKGGNYAFLERLEKESQPAD